MTILQARLATKLASGGGIFRNRQGELEDGKTNGTDMFLGCIITQLTESNAIDLDPCAYTEIPDGVICEIKGGTVLNDNDAEGLIANNINVKFGKLHPGDKVLVCAGVNRTCTKGYLAILDDTYPGFVQQMAPSNESVDDLPPFRIVGKFLEAVTAVAEQACYVYIEVL